MLTKSALQKEIADTIGTTPKNAAVFLETLLAIAYREAKRPDGFVLPGIGKVVKVKRKARIGRNPKTGEKIKIAAKTAVKFRAAKALKDAVMSTPKAAPKAKPTPKAKLKTKAKAKGKK